jgi:hypothetical protein
VEHVGSLQSQGSDDGVSCGSARSIVCESTCRPVAAAASSACELIHAGQPRAYGGLTRPTAETALMVWTEEPRLLLTKASLAALYDAIVGQSSGAGELEALGQSEARPKVSVLHLSGTQSLECAPKGRSSVERGQC